MSEEVSLTPEEEQMCAGLEQRHSEAGSWCWVDGNSERFNGFKTPAEALLHAKKNKAVPPIILSPLKTKV
ncbi:MAG: hypothetical protein WC460_05275 [Patescibacteria group bacterium]